MSYRQPGTVLTDLTFTVPLDHADPGGQQIQLFARAVEAADPPGVGLPWLLFLQGGPGFGAGRPIGRDTWLDRALRDYWVLLLDQRGSARRCTCPKPALLMRNTASWPASRRR